uniref:Uncharacterized protein n=1 Tax=Anguilla anguilla TaxID=7936 RepID=A0A0E9RVZ7_ANGAN
MAVTLTAEIFYIVTQYSNVDTRANLTAENQIVISQ